MLEKHNSFINKHIERLQQTYIHSILQYLKGGVFSI